MYVLRISLLKTRTTGAAIDKLMSISDVFGQQLTHRSGIPISDAGLYGPMLEVFHIFSGRDLSIR